jgi:hypothetical protein
MKYPLLSKTNIKELSGVPAGPGYIKKSLETRTGLHWYSYKGLSFPIAHFAVISTTQIEKIRNIK